MSEHVHKVRTPLFPPYSYVRQLLTILGDVPKASVTYMINAIWEQTGTPQNPVDWSDPDSWIKERLLSENAVLARRIWESSNRTVNPRYIYGAYLFINTYGLLVPDCNGIYRLSERGKGFLANDSNIIKELDDSEGILQLLSILATKTRAKRGDLLPEWSEFLHDHSKFGTANTIKDTLRRRIGNLIERELVARESQYYVITPSGIDYASEASEAEADPKRKVLRALATFNDGQRKALKEHIGKIHPSRFEHLIRDLLEAMGYEDVRVTGAIGDKGVDVVATVQFGITTITEVVQVKRHHGTIGRQTLDQLRGALPYHKAIRGTLITLGSFSSGCKESALFPGAAPIGLIDGDRLLDLLFEHKIGIKDRPATLYELDDEYFSEPIEPEQ